MKTYKILFATAAAAALCACNNAYDVNDGFEAETLTIEACADEVTRAVFTDITDAAGNKKQIVWASTDEFDISFIKIGVDGGSDTKNTVTATPDELLNDNKVVRFTSVTVPEGYDNFTLSYPKGKVSFIKQDTEFASVSVAIPAAQSFNNTGIAVSDIPMVSTQRSVPSTGTIKLVPMAVPVEMNITDLPNESGTNKIAKITLTGVFSDQTAGVPGFSTADYRCSIVDLSVPNFENQGGKTMTLTPAEGGELGYTADATTPFYFISAGAGKCTKLTVDIETTDALKYTKVITITEPKALYFNRGAYVKFAVDMSTATVIDMGAKFAVEWSSGYLTYDADNLGYKFASCDELGLWFKYKSLNGFVPSVSTDPMVSYNTANYDALYTKPATTVLYKSNPKTGVVANNWATATPAYQYIDGAGVLSTTYDSYEDIPLNNGDPCSLVPVAAGENAWRLPTKDEIQDLVTIGYMNADNYSFYDMGSATKTYTYESGKYYPRTMEYTDGEQTVKLRSATYVQMVSGTTNLAVNFLTTTAQICSIYFWGSELNGDNAYVYANNSMNYPVATAGIGGKVNSTVAISSTLAAKPSALQVRCVRTKK